MFMRVESFPVLHPSREGFFNLESNLNDLFRKMLGDEYFERPPEWPAVDVVEEEAGTTLVVELPGVKKQDLKVSVHDGAITISGKRESAAPTENSRWIRNEIPSGEFSRKFSLPRELQAEGITAELADGILKVTLPKAEAARPKEIKIQ